MIFKKIFAPKWQHPDANVRLKALASLTENDQALTQLALKDSDATVRLSALEKINTAPMWWQALCQDQNNNIKNKALTQLIERLKTDSNTLNDHDRQVLITQYATQKQQEQLLDIEPNASIRLTLLKQLAKPALVSQQFKQGNETEQAALLPLIMEHNLAANAVKFAKGEAKITLENQLNEQKKRQEMPLQVNEQARLILAKLNALKEKTDYQHFSPTQQKLQQQWQQLELDWLTEAEQQTYRQKHQQISTKLAEIETKLAEQHQLAQQKQQALQLSVLQLANCKALAEEISHALQLRFDGSEQIQQDWLEQKVNEAKDALTNPHLHASKELETTRNTLETLFIRVTQLGEHEAQVRQLSDKLTALRDLPHVKTHSEFDAAQQQFSQLQQQVSQQIAQLPKALSAPPKTQLKQINQQWQQAHDELIQQQNQSLEQVKRKMKDVRRLISQGRYRIAFGVFKGATQDHQLLTTLNQAKIAKEYESLNSKLNEAQDWQHYAGEPQLAQLLESAEQLVQQDCSDPTARSNAVKRLRKSWQLLGRELTKAQDKQFDTLLEQAFAPCREHFAQQQQVREQAILQRTELISQMSEAYQQFSAQHISIKQLETTVNQLHKSWQKAAKLDSKTYHALAKQFKQASAPPQNELHNYYQQNQQAKESLIAQAKHIAEQDDALAACQQLKPLQQQWQKIGFAGKQHESKLWQAFRAVNDPVFSQREQQKNAEQQQQAERVNTMQNQLAQFAEQVTHSHSKAELTKLHQQVSQFAVDKSLLGQKNELVKQIDAALQTQLKAQQQQNYRALLEALTHQNDIDPMWHTTQTSQLSSEQLLLRMELLQEKPSPSELQAERMAEQVAMLDEKHQGESTQFNTLLTLWLAQVQLPLNNTTLMRLAALFDLENT